MQKSLEGGEAGDTVRREASEVRRLLLERDTQARVAQLKLSTLQRSLQEKQSEVSHCTQLHCVQCCWIQENPNSEYFLNTYACPDRFLD